MLTFYRSQGTCEHVLKRSWLEPKPCTTLMLSRRCATLLPATKNWRSGSNMGPVRQECWRRFLPSFRFQITTVPKSVWGPHWREFRLGRVNLSVKVLGMRGRGSYAFLGIG